MGRLSSEKLHVRFTGGADAAPDAGAAWDPVTRRRYTLTHSDLTGDLFLTIGPEYDLTQISGRYTRLMRDEVLAEWRTDQAGGEPTLHVHLHVSGGFVFGSGTLRAAIFRRELPLALEAICHGDREFLGRNPRFDGAAVWVRFNARQERLRCVEAWGRPADYRLAVGSAPAPTGPGLDISP